MTELTLTRHAGSPPPAEGFDNAVRFGFFVDYLARLWPPPAGARPMETVVYGTAGAEGRDLSAKVYGRADRTERRPGIVFVHGGGWAGGTPDFHLRHAAARWQRWVGLGDDHLPVDARGAVARGASKT